MERSRADRVIADWDSISRRARRPGLPERRTVTTALPASTVTAAVALVLAIAATGMWLGLPRGGAQPGAQPPASPEPSASPVEASASPLAIWGPLAVVPSSNGDQARTEGTLRVTDTCVFVEVGGTPTLLLWGADRTAWSAESRTITFENFDGTIVTVADGDDVVLGGSGGGRASEAESGISNEGWVSRTEWVSPPAPSCPLDEWWSVGAVQVSAAPTAPLLASPAEPSPSPVEPSPSPAEPPPSGAEAWGPLAVIPPQDGTDLARNEGTLRITDTCVYLESRGELSLLYWPADRTTWSGESRSITFENFDGSVVSMGDGDHVVLGGGGGSEAEGGISGEEWVRGVEWVAPPSSSCSLDPWFGVGVVEDLSAWGPLAVVPPQDGMDTLGAQGTLRITDTCVFMDVGGTPTLLFWPSDRTTWNAETRTITFENFDGTIVTVADGDDVVVGGSGGGRASEAESGISNEGWVTRVEWVVPPAPSCPLDEWWGIGDVGD